MSQSTPPPFIFYSQSSLTMPDGSVVVESITITSSLSPTIVYIPTTRPTNQQDPANGDHISTIAPIVGGVIGGFFGLLIIVAVIWFLLYVPSFYVYLHSFTFHRRRRQSYIYEQDETEPPRNTTNRKRRFELDVDTEPKPYQYGLVGQVNSSLINSPPASPTFAPPNNVNNHNNNLDASHGRQRSSLTPLMLSPSTTPTPAQSLPTTASSRPSTAGSAYPLRGGSSRPSTAGSGPNNQQQRPQSQLDHLDEFGVRPLSSQSHTGGSSWSRQSPQPPPVVAPHNWTSMAAASPPPEREGSPVSLKEPKRMLQIVNAPPSPTISIASTPDLHQFAEADLGEPPSSPLPPPSRKRPIIVHQDAGSVEPAVIVTAPPSYDG